MLPRGEENRWHREGVYRQTDTHAKPRDRDGVTIIQCKYKTFLYNWLTLWYTWNSHSTVNQLSFNNKTCFKNLRHRKLFLSHVQLFCDPVDCNPPGSSIHGILQARILEWVAISFSRWFSWPRDSHLLHWWVDSLPLSHQWEAHWNYAPFSLKRILMICS